MLEGAPRCHSEFLFCFLWGFDETTTIVLNVIVVLLAQNFENIKVDLLTSSLLRDQGTYSSDIDGFCIGSARYQQVRAQKSRAS